MKHILRASFANRVLFFSRMAWMSLVFGVFSVAYGQQELAGESGMTATGVSLTSRDGMVELAGDATALAMDGLSLTRDELLVVLRQLNAIPSQDERIVSMSVLTNGLTPYQQRGVRMMLYHFVRQQLLLRAARRDGIVVTEADRQEYVRGWQESHPGEELEAEERGMGGNSPLRVSREDIFMIYKWLNAQLDEVEIPEAYIERVKAQFQQIEKTFGQQAAQEREDFAALADKAELYSDEGFAKLAREYSDGVEADRGGVVAGEFTRSQIAEANFDQPFDTPVGETSPLIETPTSLRFIRVLEEIPGAMPGEPSRYRIAQILYTKRAMDEFPDDEAIRKDLKYQLQELTTARLILKLAEEFHFQCPLIPDLLNLKKFKEASKASAEPELLEDEGEESSADDTSEEEPVSSDDAP